MSKRKRNAIQQAAQATQATQQAIQPEIMPDAVHDAHQEVHQTTGQASAQAFTFGDPEPVLDSRSLWDYLECGFNGQWYEPPVPFEGLARSFRANPHHETALRIKRNFLVRLFKPHRLLSKMEFSSFALDFLTFGNAFLERRSARTGRPLEYKPALAKFVRRCKDLNRYVFLQSAMTQMLPYGQLGVHEFPEGELFHLIEPDINQEVYGMPEYLSAMQSLWLNEAATLFRRKYYKNGSHAGFILYMNDEKMQKADVDAIRKAMRESKGPGNFKNLFVYAPSGNKEGIKLIPIGEVAAKDEFSNIKNVSRDDVLVVHRVPPQLLGVVPQNSGGFGSIKDATEVFLVNEILPLTDRFVEVNDWAGEELIVFESVEMILNGYVSNAKVGKDMLKEMADMLISHLEANFKEI